jgi:predicted ferric reductase
VNTEVRTSLDVRRTVTGRDDKHVVSVLPGGWAEAGLIAAWPSASLPWFGGKGWRVFLLTLYPLLILTPLATLAFLSPSSDHSRAAEVGVECAVVGLTILVLQFVLTARISWIEAPFGLDVLLIFHRAMALVAAALLCVHPVMVASEEGWSLLIDPRVEWYVWVGRAAFAVLLFQVLVSLARRMIHLPYERWRRLHHPTALGLLALAFIHSIAAGEDIHGAAIFVWASLLAIAVGFWLYNHVARPQLLLRRPFRVIEVKPEAPRVWTLTLEPVRKHSLSFLPGQFQFLRLHGAEIPSEEHPFTIASSPTRSDLISLTIKESGDFTSRLGRARAGDLATVHGPFGRFSHILHPDEGNLVFVAGGVGITPLMSMLRYMRDRAEPRRVLLAYASRTAADRLFTRELESIEAGARPVLRVVHVLSEAPPSWEGEAGLLDADRVIALCGGIEGKAFYLCCPPAMLAALVRGLRRRGVHPRRIHSDFFSL